MAWEWSHTQEAYDNAENNVHGMKMAELRICYAEWHASQPTEDGDGFDEGFDQDLYQRALKEAQGTGADELAAFVWARAEEKRTCTNGGWQAWVCPYGCHTVSFDEDPDCKRRVRERARSMSKR